MFEVNTTDVIDALNFYEQGLLEQIKGLRAEVAKIKSAKEVIEDAARSLAEDYTTEAPVVEEEPVFYKRFY